MKNRMNGKGFALIEILTVVAIITLLAAIAIPNLFRPKIFANDALAKSTLRSLSTASETFSNVIAGNYPDDITSLTGATPPLIQASYCDQSVAGFSYSCILNEGNYEFTATPLTIGSTGTTTWTIATGGVLTP